MSTPLSIGMLGMGNAGLAFVPAIRKHPEFELAAFVEPNDDARSAAEAQHGVPGHATLAQLLASGPRLDAVCIASPTEYHTAQALEAIDAGLHVLVEKPMAITLEDARVMVHAARDRGVTLLVGHSHSYDLPIRKMAEVIASGRLGAVRMAHNWCFTDWIYRPRRPDELDIRLGGGVTFRQGSHQFDVLRLLCGGQVRRVRARAFDLDRERRSIGAHCVYLDFENGAVATAVYNGYGGFQTTEILDGLSEWGFPAPEQGWSVKRRGEGGRDAAAEIQAKQARAGKVIPDQAPFHPFFGITLVSCERGDIRQSPKGLYVYDRDGVEEITFPTDRTPRDLVLDELGDAIRGRSAAVHDGQWGMANLEVCLAAIASSERSAEVELKEQRAVAV
ncbi:Gfo/Idh/MocA family oxidoreductase [Hydrogenophaga sp. 2FB]|jgi:phthalate 4,5-cis-dihydrodiol dehydrogenase|uniref:Gfo/Idh/MocA family protein n=1 Tax=Hydrogenophaga sp. 2FB TaxID=2502187 RepID=UPI0010F5C445|nr:Gfo/Idh/MocA family oxidoreductase [Hydrogenophaga sp. 2FB]